MDLGLENRMVLITGGSVGIGLAVAKTFVFLASKQSSYTLGTSVYVDAGAIRTVL